MNNILAEKIRITAEYEAGQSFMALELLYPENEEIYDYQIEMIANNPRPSIIPFEIRRKNENIIFHYNIASKATLKDFLRYKKFSKYAFVDMLSQVTGTILESSNLFLYEKNFIISESTVYVDPGKGIISILYLPVKMERDHYQELKEFIITLITKTAVIEMQPGDNYLQRIIEFVKTPEFNLFDFNKLLNDIKSECKSSVSYSTENPIFSKQETNIREGYENNGIKQSLKMQSADSKNKKTANKYSFKTILTGILFQVIVIGLAFAIEYLMKQQNIKEDTRYILIGMFVLVADLLAYKYIINRKVEIYKTVGKKSNVKKRNSLSMTKKEISNVELSNSVAKNENKDITDLGAGKYIEGPKGYDETTILYEAAKNGAYLLFEEGGAVRKFNIRKERFLVGRNSDLADLIIDEKSVGRVHAEILTKGDEYFIIDKDSKNGTFINNERLTNGQEYRLINNSSIIFANKEYKFLME